MAKEAKELAEQLAASIKRRNALILEWHNTGETLRTIADHFGLSWSGVRKIINKEQPQ